MSGNSKNILILDASYFIFYRYTALLAWYRHSKQEISDDIIKDTFFQSMFKKRIIQTLEDLEKKYSPNNILVCFDGHHVWRKEILPTYKQNRTHSDVFLSSFKRAEKILKTYISKKNNYFEIHHDNLEADDIVHFMTRKLASYNIYNITIIANDSDYIPLLQLYSVQIVTLSGKPIRAPNKDELQYFMLVKILSGDKSDNIPSVFPRCGKKTALQLAKNPEKLNTKLASSSVWNNNFVRNTILIDNEKIPIKYIKWLQSSWLSFSKKIFVKELK